MAGSGYVNAQAQESREQQPILIGIEYAEAGMAEPFSALGVPAVKYFPEEIAWEKMQPFKNAPLNFRPLDRYVREYQDAGFRELVVALKTQGSWAVRDARKNFCPKPEYLDAYETWVRRVVERYDMDGNNDMPNLRAPVRYYEIGTEFSSYEPEPVDDYLVMLERAYRGAHAASKSVIVAHAAFLVTTAFKDHPTPDRYEASFKAVDARIMAHTLSDIRRVLDRPDIFDVIDVHALGDPYEIEGLVTWLIYEMNRRGYHKPIILGDTATSPLIAWGPATTCNAVPKKMGIMIPPATEADRCRLAAYFTRLIDGNEAAVAWTQSFAASDLVKKVVVAAEQGIALINTAFMEDLSFLKLKLFKAGAGTSPWSGMALTQSKPLTNERTVIGFRPSFYALKQLVTHLNGSRAVERVVVADPRIRLYRVRASGRRCSIAWVEPDRIVLPGEPLPQVVLAFKTSDSRVRVEPLMIRQGETRPERVTVQAQDGTANITLMPTPLFILTD